MSLAKALRVKDVELLLGRPLKKTPSRKVLNLFAVSVCGITVEKMLAWKTKKRTASEKNLIQIAGILHREILRRMNK